MGDAPWSPAAFEDRYAATADPWDFASSPYEQGRYAAILASLRPRPHRYRVGYEPACSVGVLTEALLDRCDVVVATDVSPTAVARARQRCAGRPGAVISVGAVQDGPGTAVAPDLVVFSEVGYYFDRHELRAVTEDLVRTAGAGADLVACHRTGESVDHRLGGAEVPEVLGHALAGRADHLGGAVHDGFVLDTWQLR